MDDLNREGLELASIGQKALAALFDILLLFVLSLGCLGIYLFIAHIDGMLSTTIYMILLLFFLLLCCVYEVCMIYFFGATVGYLLLSLRCIDRALFDTPRLLAASIRGVLCALNFYLVFFILMPPLSLYMFFSPLRQGLYDVLANTIVVKTP